MEFLLLVHRLFSYLYSVGPMSSCNIPRIMLNDVNILIKQTVKKIGSIGLDECN